MKPTPPILCHVAEHLVSIAVADSEAPRPCAVAVRRLMNGLYACSFVVPGPGRATHWGPALVPGGPSKGTEEQAIALALRCAALLGVPFLPCYHAGSLIADAGGA